MRRIAAGRRERVRASTNGATSDRQRAVQAGFASANNCTRLHLWLPLVPRSSRAKFAARPRSASRTQAHSLCERPEPHPCLSRPRRSPRFGKPAALASRVARHFGISSIPM